MRNGPFNRLKKLDRRDGLGQKINRTRFDGSHRGGDMGMPNEDMIGSVEPSVLRRSCNSGPLSPGIRTSRRMQPGTLSLGERSNRCTAEA